MGLHQGLEALLLGRGDGLEDDLAKVHARGLGQGDVEGLYTLLPGRCTESRATPC